MTTFNLVKINISLLRKYFAEPVKCGKLVSKENNATKATISGVSIVKYSMSFVNSLSLNTIYLEMVRSHKDGKARQMVAHADGPVFPPSQHTATASRPGTVPVTPETHKQCTTLITVSLQVRMRALNILAMIDKQSDLFDILNSFHHWLMILNQ